MIFVVSVYGRVIKPKAHFEDPFPLPPFSCPQLPTPPPATNVRQLRPGNIKVMMALGDSITAGFAMQGWLPRDFEEWRGYVYSIGGEENAYTFADFMTVFNPNIQGLAQGNTWPLTAGAWLDGAVSMAKVADVIPQVQYLVNTLQTEYATTVDFENDWKLLTLLIGANNLCPCCSGEQSSIPANFQAELKTVLTLIQKSIPRTFVNLVTIFNISGVWNAGQTSYYCMALWEGVTNGECPCLTDGSAADRQMMDDYAIQYNVLSQQLAMEFQNMNDPNFTVVVQPGISGINITAFGEQYLSALDCFHPNLAANEAFAYQLWNNMMTPQGQKATSPDINNLEILCPGEDSYIQ